MTKKKAAPEPTGLVQTQFRLPASLLGAMDAYAEELNDGREWPKLTRADIARKGIQWLMDHKDAWAEELQP